MATNPGTELATLDFGNLIGGPLVAVIKAQSLAAEATAKFIREVGFYPDDYAGKDSDNKPLAGTPIYVDFKYPKEVQPYQPKVEAVAPVVAVAATATAPEVIGVANVDKKDAVPAKYQEMKISVPILTMLPIPFIKVDIITIDFNAKISSTEVATSSSDLSASGTLNASYGGKRASVSFSGTVAYKKSTTSGSSVERTYSMAIHVQASQDEMPAGMEKLLNILEGAMKSTPVLPAP